MAIVTGDLYKGFTFGDISSKAYGVYITQEAAYDAPERDTEVVEIAGRNGAYILDKGRYKNITVSYKCGIALDDEQSFESAIRTFRNALASKAGKYVRLEDEYNPNEYRQAAFLGGIDVDMADRRAGEFTVSFDAKPQRFLKSGESTITVGSSRTITNPTLYDSHPLLSFTASGSGSGNIIINNNTISVTNKPIGDIVLANVVKLESGKYVNWQDTSRYLSGDAIRIESIPAVQTTVVMDSYSYTNYTSYRSDDMDYLSTISTPRGMLITHSIPNPPQFVAGTTKSVIYTATVIEKVKEKTTGDIVDNTLDITVQITYDGLNRITVTSTVTVDLGTATTAVTLNTITVNSTKQSLVGTAYIDLDIGEAYAIDRGAVVSINDSVSLGASLPALKSGANIISKTGAVENLKVTPRWWEL